MGRHLPAVQGERLEGHDRVPRELRAVEGEGDLLHAVHRIGHEGHGGGDGLAVGAHGLAGLPVHERAGERVLLAGREPRVGDGVHDGHRVIRHGLVVAVVRVGRLGAHSRCGRSLRGQRVVGERAQVHGRGVAVDRDVEGRDERAVGVCLAGKLLDRVGVVGQRPLGVVGLGATEPHAGVSRATVGVLGVGVPAGRRGGLAVAVGHDHVTLARGLAGDLEGHARESLLGAVGHLHEREVAAHHLLGELALGRELEDGEVVPDILSSDREYVLLGVGEVARGRRHLAHGDAAQRDVFEGYLAVLGGSPDRLGLAVLLERRLVDGAVERCRALGRRLAGLGVGLLEAEDDGHGRVLSVHHGVVAGDGDLVLVARKCVACGGLDLAHGVGAVGHAGVGAAVPVLAGRDARHELVPLIDAVDGALEAVVAVALGDALVRRGLGEPDAPAAARGKHGLHGGLSGNGAHGAAPVDGGIASLVDRRLVRELSGSRDHGGVGVREVGLAGRTGGEPHGHLRHSLRLGIAPLGAAYNVRRGIAPGEEVVLRRRGLAQVGVVLAASSRSVGVVVVAVGDLPLQGAVANALVHGGVAALYLIAADVDGPRVGVGRRLRQAGRERERRREGQARGASDESLSRLLHCAPRDTRNKSG